MRLWRSEDNLGKAVLYFFHTVLREWTQDLRLARRCYYLLYNTHSQGDVLKWYLWRRSGEEKDSIKETNRKAFVTVQGRMTGKATFIEVVRRGQDEDVFVDRMWWGKKRVKDDSQVISMSNWMNSIVIYRGREPLGNNRECVSVCLGMLFDWVMKWQKVNFVCKHS